MLVGISGIDASGKGYLAAKIADRLQMEGLKVALIRADDWLNLPGVCMNREHYAEHFYEHAIRFDEMFERLIVPLAQDRHLVVAGGSDAGRTRVSPADVKVPGESIRTISRHLGVCLPMNFTSIVCHQFLRARTDGLPIGDGLYGSSGIKLFLPVVC